MKRSEFKQMVKAFSIWKIDKKKGDYTLPSGSRLSNYLEELADKLCKSNDVAIAKDGDVYAVIKFGSDYIIYVPFGALELFEEEEQEKRLKAFVRELIERR